MPHSVGFLGKEHHAMVVHMHNELANLVLGRGKLKDFWNWLKEKTVRFNAQVLMGDFNMSLFRVIPELRSRGAVIEVGAWYPWKSLKGEPMSDSCGIVFVNIRGVFTLFKSLDDLHDRDLTGVLARGRAVADSAVADTRILPRGGAVADPAVADTVEDGDDRNNSETDKDFDNSADEPPDRHGGFDSIETEAGPGMPLRTYLPKDIDLTEKFRESLTPSNRWAAVAATHNDRKVDGIKFKEKRLDARI